MPAGKTLLMIKKVAQEDPSSNILVLSRLTRLVNIIKTAVDEKRDDGGENISFSTYEEHLQQLARRVVPDEDSDYKSFVHFSKVHYDCDSESGTSFYKEFINGEHNERNEKKGKKYCSDRERKKMKDASIEALTLWYAIITIKSHASCATTKSHLTEDEYLALPPSYGLTHMQRQVCYDMYTTYERWRVNSSYWDEADRVLYIMSCGPSVLRDSAFMPWAQRVNKFGEYNLLNEELAPLHPFFFDSVFLDEVSNM